MGRVNGHLLEGGQLIWAARLALAGITWYERVNGGVDPEARQVAADLAASARGTAVVLVSDERGNAEPPAAVIVSGWPSTQTVAAAAGVLGITTRAVRGRCQNGTLAATKTAAGWQIEEWSVAALAARRKETT